MNERGIVGGRGRFARCETSHSSSLTEFTDGTPKQVLQAPDRVAYPAASIPASLSVTSFSDQKTSVVIIGFQHEAGRGLSLGRDYR